MRRQDNKSSPLIMGKGGDPSPLKTLQAPLQNGFVVALALTNKRQLRQAQIGQAIKNISSPLFMSH